MCLWAAVETGVFWKKYVQETPFVKVKVTGFDFLPGSKAAQYGNSTGLITFGERVPFVSSVKELLNGGDGAGLPPVQRDRPGIV